MPAAGSFPGRLYGVAATSPSNAWAVGLGGSGTLFLHWNGSTWTQAPSSPGFLVRVAATSASDVWAVGGTDWFKPSTLIEHWDGTAWTRVPSPTPGGGAQLAAVAATSADNAWAVGAVGPGPGIPPGPGTMTLIVPWNGTAWK